MSVPNIDKQSTQIHIFFNDGEFWYFKRPYLSNTKTCTINLKTMAKTLNDLSGTMLDKSQPIVVMLPEKSMFVNVYQNCNVW